MQNIVFTNSRIARPNKGSDGRANILKNFVLLITPSDELGPEKVKLGQSNIKALTTTENTRSLTVNNTVENVGRMTRIPRHIIVNVHRFTIQFPSDRAVSVYGDRDVEARNVGVTGRSDFPNDAIVERVQK